MRHSFWVASKFRFTFRSKWLTARFAVSLASLPLYKKSDDWHVAVFNKNSRRAGASHANQSWSTLSLPSCGLIRELTANRRLSFYWIGTTGKAHSIFDGLIRSLRRRYITYFFIAPVAFGVLYWRCAAGQPTNPTVIQCFAIGVWRSFDAVAKQSEKTCSNQ